MYKVLLALYKLKLDKPQKKNKDQRFEQRLLNLLANPHTDILAQLHTIAHNISL
jgi:hypothetical protein